MNKPTLNTKQFSYNKGTKSFHADYTDVFGLTFPVPKHIFLESQKTGRVVEYWLSSQQRDQDNDVHSWTYRPVNAKAQINGDVIAQTSVVIYND